MMDTKDTPMRPGAVLLCAAGGLLAVIALAYVALALVPSNLRYNLSKSRPVGIYAKGPLPEEINRGQSVMVCISGEAMQLALRRGYLRPPSRRDCAPGATDIIKFVQAVPGDTVLVATSGVFVNGERVAPPPRIRDSRGHPLDPEYGIHVLDPGMYWVGTDYKKGYDSRYFGPVPRSHLAASVNLLLPLAPIIELLL